MPVKKTTRTKKTKPPLETPEEATPEEPATDHAPEDAVLPNPENEKEEISDRQLFSVQMEMNLRRRDQGQKSRTPQQLKRWIRQNSQIPKRIIPGPKIRVM